MAKKLRIDSLLVERGLFESREKAQRSVMAGEVKIFFDNWLLKHKFPFAEFKMRNRVGAAFVTGGAISNGKETGMTPS